MATQSPVKNFQFVLEIDGVDQIQIQKVKMPEPEITTAKHGAGNVEQQTAGMVKYNNATLEKLSIMESGSDWAYAWLTQVQNPDTGSGGLPSQYMRNVVLKEMAPNGVTAVRRWMWENCFPVKITHSDRDRLNSDNAIDTIELVVNGVRQLT